MTGIVLFITASTLGVGLLAGQYRFMEVVRTTLLSIGRIAGGMLASEIGRLKEDVAGVALQVRLAEGGAAGPVEDLLAAQLRANPSLLALTVAEIGGGTLHVGDPDSLPSGNFPDPGLLRAAAGLTYVSPTSRTPDGNLVMRIFAPVDSGRVLVATFDGLYFSRLLTPYGIWEDGGIFILDAEGTYVAGSRHRELVLGRANHRESLPEGTDFFLGREEGTVRQFVLAGRRVLAAYSPVPGDEGWTVAISSPLSESPLTRVREVLLISAGMLALLGGAVALGASKLMAASYRKMAELKLAAESASVSKTKFLANMSHEMRTPLNAIVGLSELELAGARLPGDSFSNVEKIHGAGMTLMGIVNDLLDVGKIESGELRLTPVVYDLPGLIHDTTQLNMVRLGGKPVEFTLEIDENLPESLKGDELKVKQIFNNLLSNAFKYTDSGSVRWSLSFERPDDPTDDRVTLVSTVGDTGCGIRPEDFDRLYHDYSQVNIEANYHVEGTGLGLSITKKLVELMGGRIDLESEYGRGSAFTVRFLQEAVPDAGPVGNETVRNLREFRYAECRHSRNRALVRSDMSYAAVLVVDDVPVNLDIVRGLLKPYRIRVETADSALEAIELVRAGEPRFDAIFMDHMMPVMNGVQAVRIIRGEIGGEYAANVPIIALSANALAGNETLYTENGFQESLSKPLSLQSLDRVLRRWVRNPAKEKPGTPDPDRHEGDQARPISAGDRTRSFAPQNHAGGQAPLSRSLAAQVSGYPPSGVPPRNAPQQPPEFCPAKLQAHPPSEDGPPSPATPPQQPPEFCPAKLQAHPPSEDGPPSPQTVPPEPEPAEPSPEGQGIPFADLVPGLDLEAGLAVIDNDFAVYLEILASFARHAPTKLDIVKTAARGTAADGPDSGLGDYRIAVHALKGSGRSIGALELGRLASDLEDAAVQGRTDFIRERNASFVLAAEKLLADIALFLAAHAGPVERKPERESPDPEVLSRILRACRDYDMAALRPAAEELASFSYPAMPDLPQWIIDRADVSDFEGIRKRLGG